MVVHHPFQKLCIVQAQRTDGAILLAASASSLCSITVATGELLSQWPFHDEDENGYSTGEEGGETENGKRPSKRRKLEREDTAVSDESLEIATERKKGERRKTKILDLRRPNISHIVATSNGEHVVAVTAEDKSIHVFAVSSATGRLSERSTRAMPKRPCAVRLSRDETTILIGDKFGDVYSLPLIPSADFVPKLRAIASECDDREKTGVASSDRRHSLGSTVDAGKFEPSASELTVHTKGNREALMQQRKQAYRPRKDGPRFEHSLILGHVSLLTDLYLASAIIRDHDGSSKARDFILTSDRDEHIRVSRFPQSHIIEGYCYGTCEFISCLCVHPDRPEMLISGNGEPSLRSFFWMDNRQLSPVLLARIVTQILENHISLQDRFTADGRDVNQLAVRQIVPISTVNPDLTSPPAPVSLLLVTLEGLPFVLTFTLSNDTNDDRPPQYVDHSPILAGNVLDIVQISGTSKVVLSLDIIHQPGSVKSLKSFQTPEGHHNGDINTNMNHDDNDDNDNNKGPDISEQALTLFELEIELKVKFDGEGEDVSEAKAAVKWHREQKATFDCETIMKYLPALEDSAAQTATMTTASASASATARAKRDGKNKAPHGDGSVSASVSASTKTYSPLGEFLYGLENLRKKRGQALEDEEEATDLGVGGDDG